MIRAIPFILVGLLAVPAAADSLDEAKLAASRHLEAWDVTAAGRILAELPPNGEADIEVLYLRSRHAFLRSRYREAIDLIRAALKHAPDDKSLNATLGLYERTAATVKDFKEVTTSGGHFVIAFQPGVDEVLVPYADEALEKAYSALGELFRFQPREPVRVEIYPQVQNLADVSPLKPSEIRASGTIALCKYNRLMIVSPRALVYGYEWLDTLAHEYIHLLITRRTNNKTPIWLHEGMAKFFENRWREPTNAVLTPTSEDLLAHAVREKRLIRFEAMSPSMAKLPTQEDTALAFAEVFMVMEMLYDKGGVDAINKLLDELGAGRSDRQAVEAVAQKSFGRFQREWRNYLYQRNLRTLPTYARARLLFRDKAKPKDELKDIPEEQARKLAYLGDRLAVRRRYGAAAKEYAKALDKAGGPNPLIAAKLASALLKQGKHQDIDRVVSPAMELNPQHVLLYLYRGKARLAVGEYDKARADLEAAIRINPFDPEVHGLLAEALGKLGFAERAEMERRHQQLVTAN